MADEIQPQHQALPAIANALQNMHCFLARALASGARTIATGPLAQQAAHMTAVIGNVADVERQLLAAETELQRLKPHQDFLALCREVRAEQQVFVLEHPDTAADVEFLAGAILDRMDGVGHPDDSRDNLLAVAAIALQAVRTLDAQARNRPMEACDAG